MTLQRLQVMEPMLIMRLPPVVEALAANIIRPRPTVELEVAFKQTVVALKVDLTNRAYQEYL